MLEEYNASRVYPAAQQNFFNNIDRKNAEVNQSIEHVDVSLSDYLEISMRSDHKSLLNLTTKHALMGNSLCNVTGKGAQQKIANYRLDLIDGSTTSYTKYLKDSKISKEARELNDLVPLVAMVTVEANKEKAKKKEHKTKRLLERL